MKLLLDENLSDRIVNLISDLWPGSAHVIASGLAHADDATVWNHAKEGGYAIVSKDADFHHRSLVFGHPPKIIFLRLGNCSTNRVVQVLRENAEVIGEFGANPSANILVLD